jgi:hypothetical protein
MPSRLSPRPYRRQERSSSLPVFIPPQLSQLVKSPPTGSNWAHELKFDGFRIHARFDRGQVKLLTRKGVDWSERYETTAKALSKLKAYVDGELSPCDLTERHHLLGKEASSCSAAKAVLLSLIRPRYRHAIALDLWLQRIAGIGDHPTAQHRHPRFSAYAPTLCYLNTIDGQKHVAAYGFQSDHFPTAENADAGRNRASGLFSGLPRHESWIPANV